MRGRWAAAAVGASVAKNKMEATAAKQQAAAAQQATTGSTANSTPTTAGRSRRYNSKTSKIKQSQTAGIDIRGRVSKSEGGPNSQIIGNNEQLLNLYSSNLFKVTQTGQFPFVKIFMTHS